MVEVVGELSVGEASGAAGKLYRHQVGPPWHVLVAVGVLLLAFGANQLTAALRNEFGFPAYWEELVPLPILVVGMMIYFWLFKKIVKTSFRARLRSQGQPMVMLHKVVADPGRLSHFTGDVEFHARWSGVTEVFEAKGYWIFMAQGGGVFVPRRFFASEAAERCFLSEALSYMTPAAQARSAAARRALGT